MSTVYENAVDTLREVGDTVREVGGRIAHEVPSTIPSGMSIPNVEWPDDLVDRVASGGRSTRGRRMLYIGGAVALVVAVAWFVRRRRSDDADSGLRVAESDGNRNAA